MYIKHYFIFLLLFTFISCHTSSEIVSENHVAFTAPTTRILVTMDGPEELSFYYHSLRYYLTHYLSERNVTTEFHIPKHLSIYGEESNLEEKINSFQPKVILKIKFKGLVRTGSFYPNEIHRNNLFTEFFMQMFDSESGMLLWGCSQRVSGNQKLAALNMNNKVAKSPALVIVNEMREDYVVP